MRKSKRPTSTICSQSNAQLTECIIYEILYFICMIPHISAMLIQVFWAHWIFLIFSFSVRTCSSKAIVLFCNTFKILCLILLQILHLFLLNLLLNILFIVFLWLLVKFIADLRILCNLTRVNLSLRSSL